MKMTEAAYRVLLQVLKNDTVNGIIWQGKTLANHTGKIKLSVRKNLANGLKSLHMLQCTI